MLDPVNTPEGEATEASATPVATEATEVEAAGTADASTATPAVDADVDADADVDTSVSGTNTTVLAGRVGKVLGIPRSQTLRIISVIFAEIGNGLARGEVVRVHSFGNFKPIKTQERVGRNLQTGEATTIEASTRAHFTPAQHLKEKTRTHTQEDLFLAAQIDPSAPVPAPKAKNKAPKTAKVKAAKAPKAAAAPKAPKAAAAPKATKAAAAPKAPVAPLRRPVVQTPKAIPTTIAAPAVEVPAPEVAVEEIL